MMNEDADNGMTTINVKDELDDVEILSEPYIPRHDLFGPRRRLLVGIVLVVVVIIVIISVSVSKNNNEPASPYASVQDEDQELHDMVKQALQGMKVPNDDLLLTDSYQHKAFTWLSKNGNLASYNRTQKLQRYSLAAFYYATYNVAHEYSLNPGVWKNENKWLSDELECEWAGISCDHNNLVNSIALEDNNLSGKLPQDLALIRDPLRTINVTSNKIFMKGDDFVLFVHAHRLHTLNIDDNFMYSETGLPTELKSLTSLEQFISSYNLMSGPLDNGVLQTLTKLTHLECESNFFTGALPFLEQMPSLQYIYLRRNNLKSHLNFLKSSNLTNLFSIWLDNNNIFQSIPTQVGHLVSLASFSVSNTSLTGTIPTQFGALPDLNRIWIYGNKLTGTVPTELENLTKLEVLDIHNNDLKGVMPDGVCDTIKASNYTKKELVVDCDKVNCTCCTKCA